MSRRWSDDDIRALREMSRRRTPIREQARRLGRTVSAVRGKRNALGLVPDGRPRRCKRKLPSGTKGQQAYQMRKAGEKWANIADVLGNSAASSAASYAKTRGLPWPLKKR